jgi:hypothetical protein
MDLTTDLVLPSEPEEDIEQFILPNLLQPHQEFAFHARLGILSLLEKKDDHVFIMRQEGFTEKEWIVLRPFLMTTYPYHCSSWWLHASFRKGGNPTESEIQLSRSRLKEAKLLGVWDREMRPIRNVVSRVRAKLTPFGIEIVASVEKGYMLMLTSQHSYTLAKNAERR